MALRRRLLKEERRPVWVAVCVWPGEFDDWRAKGSKPTAFTENPENRQKRSPPPRTCLRVRGDSLIDGLLIRRHRSRFPSLNAYAPSHVAIGWPSSTAVPRKRSYRGRAAPNRSLLGQIAPRDHVGLPARRVSLIRRSPPVIRAKRTRRYRLGDRCVPSKCFLFVPADLSASDAEARRMLGFAMPP